MSKEINISEHDKVELEILQDQINASYTGILAYIFLIKSSQESIDVIKSKYLDKNERTPLIDPAVNANMATVLSFYAILQLTRVSYVRMNQLIYEYETGQSTISPEYKIQIFNGFVISVLNFIDQRIKEANAPITPLTPFV